MLAPQPRAHSDPTATVAADHCSTRGRGGPASQLGPLARPGPEAAVEIVIAECSAILLWPF